jgi:hypothetical protein
MGKVFHFINRYVSPVFILATIISIDRLWFTPYKSTTQEDSRFFALFLIVFNTISILMLVFLLSGYFKEKIPSDLKKSLTFIKYSK